MIKKAKKFEIAFIFVVVLIYCSCLGVCASGITSKVTFDDNVAAISGTVTGVTGATQVTLLVGEPGDIVYIEQAASESDGSFSFEVPFDSSIPLGEYPYKIGSGARVGTYEGVIDYKGAVTYVTNQFLTADLNVSVNAYIPTVTGTISCTEGKTVSVTVTNVTDNTIIAEETITSADGEHAVSYTLPTLMSTKEYSLAVTVNDGTEQQVVLNVSIDCKVVSVEAAGTVNVSENTWLDMQVQSVDSDLISKSGTVTASKEVSLEIPNLVAYADIDVVAKGYETLEISSEGIAVNRLDNQKLYDSLKKNIPTLDTESMGVIYSHELEKVTGILDLSNSNIENIDGLQYCTAITGLILKNNKISSLDPIANLSNVVFADVSNNKITSVTDFDNRKLRYLKLNDNQISDILDLGNCTMLVHLDLANNNIDDITAIGNLQFIKYLDLRNNQLTDVSMLPDTLYHSLLISGNNIETMPEYDIVNE